MYVESIINFGAYLLEKRKSSHLSLILKCWNYFEIFYFPSHKTHIANISTSGQGNKANEEVISLIKKMEIARRADSQDKEFIHAILFHACGLIKTVHDDEFTNKNIEYFEQKANTEIAHHFKADNNYYENLVDENADDDQVGYYDDNEGVNDIAMEDKATDDLDEHPINYIEIIYSTIVESFSTLDLITDVIIFIQLYKSNNQWWATWMVILLLSPYLVSYGSLATLLQQKIFYSNSNKLVSLFVLLLMTPLSVFYLFSIDLIFMIYSLLSTLLFVITLTKIDIKPLLDRYIFHKILRMNRTEVIGYRRLRTLSQLLFETIPQILLQARMLWVIEINGDKNSFQIDIETIVLSISLAALHLILELGIIWLDSQTLKMSFMQYSLISLGGRVQWIPFNHFFANIVKNQLFMENIFDNNQKNIEIKRVAFNCLNYSVNCIDRDDNDEENNIDQNEKKRKLFSLDYEAIHKDIFFFRYEITFQFSNALIKYFSSELLNSPMMDIPNNFKLSTTNNVLQTFFKSILCKAQLDLGYESVGNINIFSLCELYQSSLFRLKLNINNLDNKSVNKIILNTSADNQKIQNVIISSLINYGEVKAIEWPIFDIKSLSYEDKVNIKLNILKNCLPSDKNKQMLDLTKLRNCFKNKCYVGDDCVSMRDIKSVVEEYTNKCKYDGSWCFVVMLLLLYSRGSIFGDDCVNKCCKTNTSLLNRLFNKYLPKHVKFGDMLIPFKLFECSKLFSYDQIEQIVVNLCKNWIILNEQITGNINKQNSGFIQVPTDKYDLNSFEYLGNEKFNYLMNKLLSTDTTVDHEDIGELDELVFELKFYNRYNLYLHTSLPFRRLNKFDTKKIPLTANPNNELKINKLIPQFDETNENRLQIFELTIWSDDHKFSIDDNIKQIYFIPNSQRNSSLSDGIFIYNPINNIASDENKNELTIKQNNVGLSYFNYYLLHESDNPPKLIIKTAVDCDVSVHIKYSKLYRKNDKIEKPKYRTLTAFSYSTSLFKALHANNYINKSLVTNHELMNLCVEIAFWVSVPNKAKFQIDYKQYLIVLERYCLPPIANIITSYIVHPESYLRWQHMSKLPPSQRTTKETLIIYDRQLEYTHFDSIVDFRNASVDFLLVPTTILDRSQNYYINFYFFGKGDESWAGIWSKTTYSQTGSQSHPQCHRDTITYYGGRKYSTRSAGGLKTDECVSWNGTGRDCNHGSIQGGKNGKVLLHPIEAHGEGDWINFCVDFKNNIFSVFKNGIFQGKVEGEIPDGEIYFVTVPDTAVDKFYIEEAIDDANYIYEEEDNKNDDD